MRVIAVVGLFSAFALAGCTQGTPGLGDDWEQTCPSWFRGPDVLRVGGPGFFHPNGTNSDNWDSEVNGELRGFGVTERNGSPLDWIEMDFHVRRDAEGNVVTQNGTPVQQFLFVERGILQVQFYREDNGQAGEPLLAYDTSKGPPGPNNRPQETLSWEPGFYSNFSLHIDLTDAHDPPNPGQVVAHWTLLGPRTGAGDNSAWALREATYHYWYRTCGYP